MPDEDGLAPGEAVTDLGTGSMGGVEAGPISRLSARELL
jgi:hypothetical protein